MRLLLFAVIALAGPAVAGTHAPPDAPDTPAVCSPEAPDIGLADAQILAERGALIAALDGTAPESSPLIDGGRAVDLPDGGRVAVSDQADHPAPFLQVPTPPPNASADTPQPDTEQEAPVARIILPESFALQAQTAPNPPALVYPEEAATGIGVTPDALSS